MDVGTHEFVLKATDGTDSDKVTFLVQVLAGEAVPVFRQPLGSGTTLDLSQANCIDATERRSADHGGLQHR